MKSSLEPLASNQPFAAVLFDMDGTFVDSEPKWLAAETQLMAEFGHRWSKEDQMYCLGGPLHKVGIYMWELSGKKHTPDYFRQELVKRTIEEFRNDIGYMPGALELLLELSAAAIPVALVTASPEPMMNATLQRLEGVSFDVAISSNDVKMTKPDPEAYLLAAQRLGVDIQQCIILEDSLTGITAAKASGAFVIAIPTFLGIQGQERLIVLDSLNGVSIAILSDVFLSNLSEESA